MPYITREDGERFVIPSYRDVLSAKKSALLKREILLLSQSYGEYIALQRKNVQQYEVAFSPDTGYLLGETVWHYFKRPLDLIYCEAIPNTLDAILVIVKAGSVYLDGSFPIDSIPEELLVFKTQQNNFDIYVYGDVPISKDPEEGKFSLDASSVRSFNVLEEPAFAKLPLNKAFQLQLVDTVLRAQGIGVFPIKAVVAGVVAVGLLWMGYTYMTTQKQQIPQIVPVVSAPPNPYLDYFNALASPSPGDEIGKVVFYTRKLFTAPGWNIVSLNYANGMLDATMISMGMKTAILYSWVSQNGGQVVLEQDGFHVIENFPLLKRRAPSTIMPAGQVIAAVIDNISTVIPGNTIALGQATKKNQYTENEFTVNFNQITLPTMLLIADQFANLPLVLTSVKMTSTNGSLSGSITLKALGN